MQRMTRHSIVAAAAAMFILAILANPASASLVSLFTFDGDAPGTGGIVRDQGAAGNNGTLVGTANVGADTPDALAVTRPGQVFQLDGNSDFSVHGTQPSLTLTNMFTLAGWVRRDGTQTHSVLGNELGSSHGYVLEVNTGNNVRLITFDTSDNSLISTETVADNTWTHVAATYDGAMKHVYINGVEVSNSPEASTGSLIDGNEPFMIGFAKGSGNANNYFKGSVDDIAVFDHPLTPAEIANIMAGDFSAYTTVTPANSIGIDFGQTGHALQGGYIRNEGPNDSGLLSVTVAVPNSFGGPAPTLDITVAEVDNSVNGLEYRTRNQVMGTPVNDLLEDLIATRDGKLTVTIADLAPGTYDFLSYHNDATTNGFAAGSVFDVFINGDLVLSNVAATNLSGNVNINDVAKANFQFVNGSTGDVTIDFIATPANTNGFIPLSGLLLTRTGEAPVPEPATAALACLGIGALLRRRRRVA